MPEKEKVSMDANIEVAMSLRAGLLALGFEDADIARGNTTLTKVISQTVRTEPEPNQRVCQRRASNKQPHSDQTVLGSSDQCSIITALENSAVFHSEDPSVLVRTSKKRKRKNLEENGRATTSDIESSTSWKRSTPKPRHDGVTAQAEDQHLSNFSSYLKHQPNITPCFNEGRNIQQVDTMNLYAPVLCQDNVVEACETPREAEVEERHRTETDSKLLRGPFSPLEANTIIAEGCQTPVLITDSVVADNNSSFSPRHYDQDRPKYSHSTVLPCSTPREVIYSLATSLIGGGREGSTLAGSTRQFLPPCKYMCTCSSFITLTYY
jgi:hypothetical protein